MTYCDSLILEYGATVLLPIYEKGILFTMIRISTKERIVELGPTKLIDHNLKYYGSSLRGAGDGARMILGRGNMYPVLFNEKEPQCWFPSKSPQKEDCIWFALHQIKDYIEVSKQETKVTFRDGSSFIIDISKASFDSRVSKAYKLIGRRVYRTHATQNQMAVAETNESYNTRRT
ncbi:competence protein ComK [Sporosarcina siberiensis]|uniref:Competence protein ComK n=1 Tax=Sporosarcina siberiensis TaxID=1365606 RepID=A0ABW4SI73_9BACL